MDESHFKQTDIAIHINESGNSFLFLGVTN